MAIRQISKYIKNIQIKLFPALKNNYNLDMNENPTNISTTLATFNGQLNDNRVILEFSSNHVDLTDYQNQNVIFLTIYYKSRGTKVIPSFLISPISLFISFLLIKSFLFLVGSVLNILPFS